jgi:hypothetical protein
MSATARSKVKKIDKLKNENDEIITGQQHLCEVAQKYFHELFTPKGGVLDPVLSLILPRVSEADNAILEAPITKEEVRVALFQMHPDKSPGPDGFNPAFYRNFWELCGDDIFTAIKDWLWRGYFPSTLNETNICLIPKCDNPGSMKDFRPISLCNVLYKAISKLLANRLKGVLSKYISEEQSAFVEGRSIIDNALIAIEIIHCLKRRTKGAKGKLARRIFQTLWRSNMFYALEIIFGYRPWWVEARRRLLHISKTAFGKESTVGGVDPCRVLVRKL